eukprot:TRINITY_DN72916_c0_g1_i1.p1 TRINITY_DN72916_c0_g1~~TRINITY_DN72916_c0_g1_i1.p1  ORF type:complete len:411 (+),score=49.40 TRINITY_DN72916_c0_g1_i1:84-1316(+)
MPAKVEVWAAFQHFDYHMDLDSNFKRGPGTYYKYFNAEEFQKDEPSSRGRQMSLPPRLGTEAPWRFHHKDVPCNEKPRVPRLSCPAASGDWSHDKLASSASCTSLSEVSAVKLDHGRRGRGQCSPDLGVMATSSSRSLISRDFHARGVQDIDRNPCRGSGSGPSRPHNFCLENGQVFNEEQEAKLKQSLEVMTANDASPCHPEYVDGLSQLGIECRRLLNASVTSSESKVRLAPHVSKVFAPVRRSHHQANNKPSASRAQDWKASLTGVNINSQRLVKAYSAPDNRCDKPRKRCDASTRKTVSDVHRSDADVDGPEERDDAGIEKPNCAEQESVPVAKTSSDSCHSSTSLDGSTAGESDANVSIGGESTPPLSPRECECQCDYSSCSPVSCRITATTSDVSMSVSVDEEH